MAYKLGVTHGVVKLSICLRPVLRRGSTLNRRTNAVVDSVEENVVGRVSNDMPHCKSA